VKPAPQPGEPKPGGAGEQKPAVAPPLKGGAGEQSPDTLSAEEKAKFNNETKLDTLLEGELIGLLNSINDAEKAGQWNEAFTHYQKVFDSNKDDAVTLPDRPHTTVGLRRYCLDRFSALGAEEKARYRAMFDGDAAPLLKRALGEGNRELLLEVARRYMMTSYGPKALSILGWQAFEEGSYGDAIYYWRSILKYHPAELERQPELLAGLVASLTAVGDVKGFGEIAEMARKQFGNKALKVLGKETTLGQFIDEAAAALKGGVTQYVEKWTMPGGSANQVRVVRSVPAALRKVWSYEFTANAVGAVRYSAISDGVLYVNPGDEVLAFSVWDGHVLWRANSRKTALELKGAQDRRGTTGVRPAVMTEYGRPTGVTVGKDLIYTTGYGRLLAIRRDNGRLQWYAEIADQDQPTGQFSSLVHCAVAPLVKNDRIYSAEVARMGDEQAFVVYCRDANTGKIIWRREVGKEDIVLPPGMANNIGGVGDNISIFTLPSMVCSSEGVLYISTSGGAVAAVDEMSGDLLWLTLYHRGPTAQQAPFMVDGWEYSPPAVVGDKFVVAPEDCEYLYVFDTKSGKPLWFRPRKSEQGDFNYIAGVDPQRGLIFLAGDNVVAYDLNDGRTKAEAAPLIGKAIGPGVICRNYLYIPTTEGLVAVDMDASASSGTVEAKLVVAWKDLLSADGRKEEWAVAKTAGNVAVSDDMLIITSGARVSVVYDIEKRLAAGAGNDLDGKLTMEKAEMEHALGETEKSMSDLASAIMKLRARATTVEGFDEMQYVHYAASAPASGEAGGYVSYRGTPPTTLNEYSALLIRARQSLNQMSFEALMRELGQSPGNFKFKELFAKKFDSDKVKKLLRTARDNAIDAKSYIDCELALVELAKQTRNWQEYVDLLMQMMHDWGEASYDFSRYDKQVVTRDVALFCIASITEALEKYGGNFYAKYDMLAEKELKAARERGDREALIRIAGEYPNSIYAGRALIEAMAMAGAGGDFSRQVYLAREYLWRLPNGLERYTAMAGYAEGLGKLGRIAEARLAFREMATRAAAEGVTEFTYGGDKANLSDYVQKQVVALQGAGGPPPIDTPFASAKVRRLGQISSEDYIDGAVLDPEGVAPPGLENAIFMLYVPNTSNYAELKCMDRSTLEEIWSAEVLGIPRKSWTGGVGAVGGQNAQKMRPVRVAYSGNSVVLNYGTSMSAFDPYTGGLRWLKEMTLDQQGTFPSACITADTVYLSNDADQSISAINSRTGLIQWTQNIGLIAVGEMTATPDRLVVAACARDKRDLLSLLLIDRRNGQVKGTVKDLVGMRLNVETPERQYLPSPPWYLFVKPVDEKRVFVMASDRLGMYNLANGERVWEVEVPPEKRPANAEVMGVLKNSTVCGIPMPMKAAEVGDGICAVATENYSGVRTYNLDDGKLLQTFTRPEGRYMLDWFVDKGQVVIFDAVQIADKPGMGLDYVLRAFDARTGVEQYKKDFPTGKFMFRPVVGKDHVVFLKEELNGEGTDGQGSFIVYSKADGKVINAPFMVSGLGRSPTSLILGKGREFVIKGGKKVVALRVDEDKAAGK
jgi:outer membrane protein assembly factor BamB